ncbi:MAG: sulfurtransferase, partial [Pseudomonadota bacterium]|nr:sulfurtransferase [Pseudomonadota bacterium]
MFELLINPTELARYPGRLQILDCRAKLGDPGWGKQAFEQGHIAGAQHLDLDTMLSVAPNAHGRHPLPTRQQWLAQVCALGLRNDAQIVAYDDAGGCFAARAWWMLRWLGHANVAVLDGGLGHWLGALEQGTGVATTASAFAAKEPLTRLYSSADVLDIVNATSANQPTLVDARSFERFAGHEEPIDPVAGHIPGAQCLPFTDNLDANGYFKPPGQLAERFAQYHDPNNLVCYCGSGVTATHNILAARLAGLPEPGLYAD